MLDIILATFNGAKYLDLQIFSLIKQDYKDWNLYIHDDGSTDDTVELIKKWCVQDKRIFFIDDDKKHLGPGNNFMHILKYAKSEFVCFCDQDDFWFDNKLSTYISYIQKMDSTKPACCLFSAFLWNKDRITSFLNEKSDSIESIMFTGGTQGCSMVFNKVLLQKILPLCEKNIYLHDYIIAFASLLFGHYMFIDEKLMLYRQHSANVTTHMPKDKIEKIRNAIINNRKKSFVYPQMYSDIRTLYETLYEEIDEKNKKKIKVYLELPKYNSLKRFITILLSKYRIGSHSHLHFIIKYLVRETYLGEKEC